MDLRVSSILSQSPGILLSMGKQEKGYGVGSESQCLRESSFTIFVYFVFDRTGSLLLRAGFLWLQRAGATLHCCALTSHFGGVSCCGAQVLGTWASVIAVRGLRSCGTLAQCFAACRIFLEQVSNPCAGRFSSTGPPGKSQSSFLNSQCLSCSAVSVAHIHFWKCPHNILEKSVCTVCSSNDTPFHI